ncbi:hypothetical protein ADUPG1_000962, partial [Aduncisulcus paluster]
MTGRLLLRILPIKALEKGQFQGLSSTFVFDQKCCGSKFTKKKSSMCILFLELGHNNVKGLLEEGLIAESDSPWSAPALLTDKKGNDTRLCVDYSALNRNTLPLPFPIPMIAKMLTRLGGKKWYATLDLRSGFHQINIKEDSTKYTAFTTPSGHYEYRRLPFGLKNAPTHFQGQMSRAFRGLIPEVCEIYIDDIIIAANSLEQLVEKLRQVFDRLNNLNLRLKAKKCVIGAKKIEYLGMELSEKGQTIAESRLQGIRDLKHPTNKKQLKTLLGFLGYFRQFIRNYATIASPLIEMTAKQKSFVWKEPQEGAFKKLKELLLKRPVLTH